MKYHPVHAALDRSPARFCVVPAGRRSGKTERAKRKMVKQAMTAMTMPAPYGACAPTRDQAKKIYWDDFKMLVPGWAIRDVSESHLTITLHNGASIQVIGMDRPERIEGTPWAGLILDEYGNMKPIAWTNHVRPALSDVRCKNAWCWFIGVPEGRNHYYDLYKDALGPLNVRHGGQWDAFTWPSSDILDPREVESARRELDELTFAQEYMGSFVNFTGQAYYTFREEKNCAPIRNRYNRDADLHLCFDFNVDPGICVIVQEMPLPLPAPDPVVRMLDGTTIFRNVKIIGEEIVGTGVIGEVYIPRNSNTRAVCRKVIKDWGTHQGRVFLYGDATGGARKTAATEGSDWDIVKNELYGHFGRGQVFYRVPEANPTERARINAMNSRIMTQYGEIRLMVDPVKAPYTVKDLEGVRLLEGGSGEIDKKHDPKLTHLTDGLGYYVQHEFPVRRQQTGTEDLRLPG